VPRPEFSTAVFGELREILGEDLQPTLLEYLDDSSALIDVARRAALDRNESSVRDCMHTLKSTSMVFGAVALADLAAELERLMRAGLPADIDAQLICIASAFERVRAWLNNESAILSPESGARGAV
jgi:HPt (histidine-containing phosphotransfer) domain-containing protein